MSPFGQHEQSLTHIKELVTEANGDSIIIPEGHVRGNLFLWGLISKSRNGLVTLIPFRLEPELYLPFTQVIHFIILR